MPFVGRGVSQKGWNRRLESFKKCPTNSSIHVWEWILVFHTNWILWNEVAEDRSVRNVGGGALWGGEVFGLNLGEGELEEPEDKIWGEEWQAYQILLAQTETRLSICRGDDWLQDTVWDTTDSCRVLWIRTEMKLWDVLVCVSADCCSCVN